MPANTDGLARIDVTERAQASGLLQTARQLGSALGIAAFFAVSSISGKPGVSLLAGAGVTALGILFAGIWKPQENLSEEVP